ncbi:MAG: NAD-dependent epimerase/dehydratase family protein, partial [Acidobacteria bacterium]
MKALVTGATGFTGRYLVRHLLASGDQVLATGRREVADDLGAPYHSCDLLDAD